MLGRALSRLISAALALFGAMLVSATVDITPVIGSPQIDYPAFDYRLAFWPQLALGWITMGGGGGLLVALGLLSWRDGAARATRFEVGLVAVFCFAVIALFRLASFLVWGAMGPLDVQQPTFRFALVNGLVSAALISLIWLAARQVLGMFPQAGPWRRAVWAVIGTSLALLVMILAVTLVTGLPLGRIMANWWSLIAIFAPCAGLLAAFTWRAEAPSPS